MRVSLDRFALSIFMKKVCEPGAPFTRPSFLTLNDVGDRLDGLLLVAETSHQEELKRDGGYVPRI